MFFSLSSSLFFHCSIVLCAVFVYCESMANLTLWATESRRQLTVSSYRVKIFQHVGRPTWQRLRAEMVRTVCFACFSVNCCCMKKKVLKDLRMRLCWMWCEISLILFCVFQQIVDQNDQESDRCDKEEAKSDGEVSEERYCWSAHKRSRYQCLRKGNCFLFWYFSAICGFGYVRFLILLDLWISVVMCEDCASKVAC